jgi:hypothetical protein
MRAVGVGVEAEFTIGRGGMVGDAQRSVSSPGALVHARRLAAVRHHAQADAAAAELAADRAGGGGSTRSQFAEPCFGSN